YYTGTYPNGRAAAVWQAGSRVVVLGPDEGVKGGIDLAARPVSQGPLEPLVARCRDRHHAVLGVDGKRFGSRQANRFLSGVTPVELVWATAEVGEETDLRIHARAADEKQARVLHHNAAVGVRLSPVFLATKIDVEVAAGLPSMVDGLKAERKGREVTVRCE